MVPSGSSGWVLTYKPYARSVGVSLSTMACQPRGMTGFTQASTVIPVVKFRLGALFTVTQLLTPSNERAPPKRPDLTHVAPEIVPVFPLPDESFTVVPLPSLKLYAATKPGEPAGIFT